MKSLIYISGVIIISVFLWFIRSYDPVPTYYNRAGQIKKNMRIWTDTVAVTSAAPVVNISSAGFSTIVSVQPQIIQTAGTISNFTWCNLASYTNTSVTLFLTQANNNTVNILGSIVLLGTPLQQPSTFSNMSVVLEVIGY